MRMTNRIAALLIGLTLVIANARALDLDACLARAITNKVYHAPTQSELLRARDLFSRTLQGPWAEAESKARWATLGFDLQKVITSKEALWLLTEPVGKEGGRGWYLVRTNQTSIALEAPHARNDLHSGNIGLRLFLAGNTRAFAASTITRHKADVAHLENTFFHAFTLAFIDACPTGVVVQLHGFASENHPNVEADMIASAGTRSPDPWLADFTQQLRRATSLTVLSYPQDTRQLGATLNAQGRACRQSRHCRFLHLEMSRSLRERLLRDDQLCRRILDCISVANEP